MYGFHSKYLPDPENTYQEIGSRLLPADSILTCRDVISDSHDLMNVFTVLLIIKNIVFLVNCLI